MPRNGELPDSSMLAQPPREQPSEREKVAVVGGGISGLAAAWLLERQGKEVTLYESEDRCGGHALTVDTAEFGPVDLGFQVCNLTTYPHLMGFLEALGVDTEPSDMSFALSTPDFEWGSRGLAGIFAQPGSVTSPRFLYMLFELVRFGRQAPEVLKDPKWQSATLGDYLKAKGYSAFFISHYLLPMCAAIWSCTDKDALAFPAARLIQFWVNHHLLSLVERPVWRVLKGRSQAYVDAAVKQLRDVRVGARVLSVRRHEVGGQRGYVGVRVGKAVGVGVVASEEEHAYDHVVMATHADVTRRLLGEPAHAAEAKALEAVRYQPNAVYLHTDEALMPRNKATWASWNCVQEANDKSETSLVCVSYWVNLLQNLPESAPPLFVTLNPPTPPDPAKTIRTFELSHPIFDTAAVEAQRALTHELQGVGGVWYAGAWCGYGFHEDGIRSSVDAVRRLCEAKTVTPWGEGVVCNPCLSMPQKFFCGLFTKYGGAVIPPTHGIRLVLPSGEERMLSSGPSPLEENIATVRCNDASLFQKVVLKSDIGLGEAYMDGDFDGGGADGLYRVLDVLCQAGGAADSEAEKAISSALGLLGSAMHAVSKRLEHAAHQRNSNTEEGSARNISYHYDAGNDFYATFLDQTFLYSSGIHEGLYDSLKGLDLAGPEAEAELEKAQYAKLDAMLDAAKIGKGDRVLEIGCGWGACAVRMAQRGAHVVAITVSNEQLKAAKDRVNKAGVSANVQLEYCDYRHAHGRFGTFDKVVSIEMLEAVGHEHLHSFFETVATVLKPNGLASIQVITLPDERYEAYCNSHSDFIRTYIFPGGHLPCLSIMNQISSGQGLAVENVRNVGMDYAVTLRLWRERMLARSADIRAMGYPERFIRMFEFYFVYCEAAFANRLIHDYQIAFRKEPYDRRAKKASDGDLASADGPPMDALTSMLLCMWLGLTGVMVATRPPMAIVPATIGGFLGLRASIASFFKLRPEAASLVTAVVAATLSSVGSVLVLLYALSTVKPPWSLASLLELVLTPAAPAPLLAGSRLVVGTAAGFAALRAWECVRSRNRRLEAATYAGVLICYVAALYLNAFLLALCPANLCEIHSAMMRLRALRQHNKGVVHDASSASAAAHAGGNETLWRFSWAAYVLCRVVPHLTLLVFFTRAAPSLQGQKGYTFAVVGLWNLALTNCLLGYRMYVAQNADRAAALIATQSEGRHRSEGAEAMPAVPEHAALRWNPACVLASVGSLVAWGFVIAQQEAPCAKLVAATTAGYALAYALLRATGWLQPSSGRLTPIEAAEWRERVLGTINAVVLTVGSVLCFLEWPGYAGAEAFVSAHLWSHPVTFASLFVGYLQWDLAWVLWHYADLPDPSSTVHHILFSAITHYVLWGWYFKKPFAWLSACELSTPFLNARWFLAVLDRKAGKGYVYASALFAVTFLLTRVVGYGLGILDLWQNKALWVGAKTGLHAVVAGTHAGFLLNLFWSKSVVGALRRALNPAKPAERKQ